MNSIVIGGHAFTDKDILSGSVHLENAMVAETLQADTLSVTIQAEEGGGQLQDVLGVYLFSVNDDPLYASDSVDVDSVISSLAYGDEIEFYRGEDLYAKFFLRNVTRTAKNAYSIEAVSLVGLLANIKHNGGIYGIDNADTVGDIVSDIMGSLPYDIDPDVESILIFGWLPIDSARNNLQKVLFACGASIVKKTDGSIQITFNVPYDAKVIAEDDLYEGGQNSLTSMATSVTLVEHTFYKDSDTEEVLLFDNSQGLSVSEAKQVFGAPYYSYRVEGLTLDETHPNYAIVSGQGKLYGIPYAHQQRSLTIGNTNVINPKEISVSDDTLISSYNSANALQRLASYYGSAKETDYGLVVNGEHAGDLISFTDPFGGSNVGYIKEMDITLSGTLKSTQTKIATNWKPNHVGNSYDSYIIIDENNVENGAWTPYPWLVGIEGLLAIFNGSQGGEGGYDGEDGEDAPNGTATTYYVPTEGSRIILSAGSAGKGGKGGRGGYGGEGARKYNLVQLTLASSHSVTLGTAGTGGAKETEGALGGITTFDSYDSDNLELSGEYVNIVDGSIYCDKGVDGTDGGDGGDGGAASASNPNAPVVYESGADGQDVATHTGGDGTEGSTNSWSHTQIGTINMNVGGGGGGGASQNANGSDAGEADQSITWQSHPSAQVLYASKKGGDGGDGANASAITSTTRLGRGGRGGHGGGGGGGAGASAAGAVIYAVSPATGGTGGQGAAGGTGSKGFGVFYFSAEDAGFLKAAIHQGGIYTDGDGVSGLSISWTELPSQTVQEWAKTQQSVCIPAGATITCTMMTGEGTWATYAGKHGGVWVNGELVYQGTGRPDSATHQFPTETYTYTATTDIDVVIVCTFGISAGAAWKYSEIRITEA
ncbi:MAG: hypothetical protein IKF39_01655 [Oscillospiraceae bacterium]|nr:hypothetical protein [Oscillospiraceae bacterium]